MKVLQNNFTTPEQSKRLLELGVPADSADMYYKHTMLAPYILSNGVLFSVYSKVEDIIPCWSVGRLMEIYDTCVENVDEWPPVRSGISYVINVICAIDYVVKNNLIDFSKLNK